jgi:hypothetical protein
VSDLDWLPWTALRPSALRQRVLRVALVLTTAVLAATTVAAWQSPDALRLSAFYLASAGFLLVFLRLQRKQVALELRVTAAGELWLREDAEAEPRRVQARFISPLLVLLQGSGQRLAVWADALSAEQFRRLAALLRWVRAPDASNGAPTQPES